MKSCLQCTHCKVNISLAFPLQYRHWTAEAIGDHIKWVMGDYKVRKTYDIPLSFGQLYTKTHRCRVRCAMGEWMTTKGEEKVFRYPKEFTRSNGAIISRYRSKAMCCEYFDGEEE